MKEKILNSKFTWIALIITLVISIIVLLSLNNNKVENNQNKDKNNNLVSNDNNVNNVNKDNDKDIDKGIVIDDKEKIEEKVSYNFELKGEKNITLYVGESYVEPGFTAVDSKNNNLNDYVKQTGDVDTNTQGTYHLIYTLTIENFSKKIVRTINVVEKEEHTLNMTLNGDDIIYLNKDEEYRELGVSAKSGNKDVSSNVKIVSNYIKGKVGNYTISYIYKDDLTSKTLKRNVIVFDIDSYFQVLENAIRINLDDNIQYVVLPNGMTNSNKVITYNISENKVYSFTIYAMNSKEYKKDIVVNNINKDLDNKNGNQNNNKNNVDKTPPTGTCDKILNYNGTTTFKVYSNDTDIKSYNYNNLKTTNSKSYSTKGFIRNDAYVILTDKSGNSSKKIVCKSLFNTTKVITPKSGESVKYKDESDTLKVYVTTKDGFYLTRVWAMDPVNQLKKQVVSGKTTSKPLTLLKSAVSSNDLESETVLGFNASGIITSSSTGDYGTVLNKDKSYAYLEAISLILTNGKVIKNDYKNYAADYPIYYISGINELKYIPRLSGKSVNDRKKIFQDVINGGAKNTFGFTKTPFVENGKANSVKWSGDYSAKRQAICQIDTNNFIVVTSNTKTLLRQPFADYLAGLGCKTAFNLDGGGSTTLMYKSRNSSSINTVTGGGRALTMILYFTELN